MAERPILFNTDMVKAILDGQKTQTRRLVKPSHKSAAGFFVCHNGLDEFTGVYDYDDEESMYEDSTPSPYQVGDVLWVRETWNHVKFGTGEWHYEYRADSADPLKWSNGSYAIWRPSIHMPRKAARLYLRVTDVRIERLQDMSAEDCASDGGIAQEAIDVLGIALTFGALWDNTVKMADLPRYGWSANPWVWVIEFKREDREAGT